MIVDLEEKPTESGTFELKGGGSVDLRLLSAEDIMAIRKATVTVKAEYPLLKDPATGQERYQRFEAPQFDSDLWDEMMWDRGITGYKDLFDKNKKPIPVSREMKALLMRKVPEFRQAYTDGLKVLQERDKAKAEAAPGNL